MYDIMYRANECPNTHIRSFIHNLHSLRNNWNLFTVYFSVAPLIFWCKFCIPLGTSFELLRLLFWWYSRWLFALRLIFRRYLALHSLRNDFWAENLRCSPLGTAICSFVMLCIPLGTTFELLPIFLFLCTRWCMLRFYIYIFWGILLSWSWIRKEKLQTMAPLKTFLPLWKGKGCHRKNEKDYINLYIIPSKLIRVPRSRNVIAIHIL
jgi:hypothetical protein